MNRPAPRSSKKVTYLTQCDRGGYDYRKCDATARLDKPGRWRCSDCEKFAGPLPKEAP